MVSVVLCKVLNIPKLKCACPQHSYCEILVRWGMSTNASNIAACGHCSVNLPTVITSTVDGTAEEWVSSSTMQIQEDALWITWL